MLKVVVSDIHISDLGNPKSFNSKCLTVIPRGFFACCLEGPMNVRLVYESWVYGGPIMMKFVQEAPRFVAGRYLRTVDTPLLFVENTYKMYVVVHTYLDTHVTYMTTST